MQTGHFTTFGAVVLCVTAHPSHRSPAAPTESVTSFACFSAMCHFFVPEFPRVFWVWICWVGLLVGLYGLYKTLEGGWGPVISLLLVFAHSPSSGNLFLTQT